MLGVVMASMRAHRLRLAMTGLAIALASGFVAGTLMLTDMMRASAYDQFAGDLRGVSVAVVPGESEEAIPPRDVRRVEDVTGVDAAVGDLRDPLPLLGPDGNIVGDYGTVGVAVYPDTSALSPDVVEGRHPKAPREAVLDEQTATRARAETGDTIRVVAHDKDIREFQLVGIVDFGADSEISLRGAVGLVPVTLEKVADVHAYRQLVITAAGGVAAAELRERIDAELGAKYEVLTGQQLADRRVESFVGDLEALVTGLLLFGVVAVLVATLVIYNTFQILVAQRTREMALLRCVGATRRQVFTAVMAESAGVGLVASLAGLALGLGAATVLHRLLAAGMLGDGGTVALAGLGPTTVAVSVAVGVGMTVVSGLLPARRATEVAPVSALRLQAEPGRFRLGVLRTAIIVLLGGGGAAVTAYGLAIEPGNTSMIVVACGGALVFLGVAAVLPVVAGPLGRAIGWVPGRLFGVPARLAAAGAGRNPRRTATTTLALMIGVGLVTLLTVAMNTNRATVLRNVEQQFPVDFTVQAAAVPGGGDRVGDVGDGPEGGGSSSSVGTVPREVADALRERPELGTVVEVRAARAELAGKRTTVRSVTESALGAMIDPDITAGSLDAFGRGTVLIAEDRTRELGVAVGDRVPLSTPDGTERVRVAGTFAAARPTVPEIMVPEDDLERYFGRTESSAVYADAAAGVAIGAARRIVDQVTQPYPLVEVAAAGELKRQLTSSLNQLLGIVSALLGLSIVIAVVGIANTLSLSVLERTRESALLRALGLTRRQLRRMLRTEAMIISVMGAVIGVVLGLAYGWFGSRTLPADDVVFAAPAAQITGYVVLAGVVGVLAAMLPARRAARTSVVTALAEE